MPRRLGAGSTPRLAARSRARRRRRARLRRRCGLHLRRGREGRRPRVGGLIRAARCRWPSPSPTSGTPTTAASASPRTRRLYLIAGPERALLARDDARPVRGRTAGWRARSRSPARLMWLLPLDLPARALAEPPRARAAGRRGRGTGGRARRGGRAAGRARGAAARQQPRQALGRDRARLRRLQRGQRYTVWSHAPRPTQPHSPGWKPGIRLCSTASSTSAVRGSSRSARRAATPASTRLR